MNILTRYLAKRRLPAIPRTYDMDLALGNLRLCRKDNQARSRKSADSRRHDLSRDPLMMGAGAVIGLTRRQHDLLNILRRSNAAPSYEEMRVALGISSKSGVHRLLVALEERGFVRRIKNRARAVELIDRDNVLPPPTDLGGVPSSILMAELERRGLHLVSKGVRS